MERLRELEAAGTQAPAGLWKPPLHEFDLKTHLLARIAAQLEASANPGERVRPLTPATGQDVLDAETAAFDEWLIGEWVVEVSPEDYRRFAAGEPVDI